MFWKFKKIFIFLLLTVLFVIFLKIIFGSNFNINTIYIEGNDNKTIDLSSFDELGNIFFTSTEKIAKSFKDKNPLIKSLTIIKKYPNSLYVKIIRRESKFYGYINSQIVFLDEDGIVISQGRELDQNKMVEINCSFDNKIDKNKLNDEDLIKIFKVVENIRQTANYSINYILCQENRYAVRIEGVEFVIKPDIDINLTVGSLQVLFKQFKIEGRTPKVVDLRFTKPVLYYE